LNVFNSAGNTHLLISILGAYDDGTVPNLGGQYRRVTPQRFVDTRLSGGALGTNEIRFVRLAGRGGVPIVHQTRPFPPLPGITPTVIGGVVMANVTITEPTQPTYVTVGDPAARGVFPDLSSLNAPAGASVANAVPVQLDPNGMAFVGNYAGHTHVTIDVSGYFT
jgi:hypothetical protein